MFKKIFLTLVLALSLNSSCNSMLSDKIIIEMPSEAELKELLSNYALDDFMEKTNIISSLTGEKVPAGIEIAIELAMYYYCQSLKELSHAQKRMILMQTKMSLNKIINKILENKPEAKKALDALRNKIQR